MIPIICNAKVYTLCKIHLNTMQWLHIAVYFNAVCLYTFNQLCCICDFHWIHQLLDHTPEKAVISFDKTIFSLWKKKDIYNDISYVPRLYGYPVVIIITQICPILLYFSTEIRHSPVGFNFKYGNWKTSADKMSTQYIFDFSRHKHLKTSLSILQFSFFFLHWYFTNIFIV